jgi:hypothetical protein
MKGADKMVFEGITERVDELLLRDETDPRDKERESLFFLIAGNEELWKHRNQIYNFEEGCIEPDILETGICSSSKTMIRIGFSLFNNYPTGSLLECFSGLDEHNFELVMQAIRIRMNRTEKRFYERSNKKD